MHTEKNLSFAVRTQLAELTATNPDDWFLVFRARYGVETVLRVLVQVRGSGEVMTQPFTCTTAINPILSAGCIPVYTDTSIDDLSLDTTKLHANTATRALIMQHSFGIESNMTAARTFADTHQLLLLEDSAHQVGLMAKNDRHKPLADVSIHSFGVEKMLSTKFGGAIWVNPDLKDVALREAIVTALDTLPVIDHATRSRARRYRFFNRVLNHTPAQLEKPLRKMLTRTGLFEAAIMPDELLGRNHGRAAKPDSAIMQRIHTELASYTSVLTIREATTQLYRKHLPAPLIYPKNLQLHATPVRFPVLCKSKEQAGQLFQALREHGHYSGKWYSPTIFPGVQNAKTYNYAPDLCPVAEAISSRILNLPTNITAEEAKEILHVLHGQIDR